MTSARTGDERTQNSAPSERRRSHPGRRRVGVTVLVALIIVVGLIGVAVARRDPGPDAAAPAAVPPTASPDETAVPTTLADDRAEAMSTIRALFAAVPDDPDYLGEVTITDLAAATALAGSTRPPAGAAVDDPATETWISDVFADPSGPQLGALPAFSGDLSDLQAWRTAFGFSVLETAASAWFTEPFSGLEHSAKQLAVYDVDVDPATVDAAVRSDPIWSPDLVDKQAGAHPYYVWTADAAQDLERATASRPLGVGGTMAVVDGLVLRTVEERQIAAALTVAEGATLADRADVSGVLASLERYDPYEMSLTNLSPSMLDQQPDSTPAPLRPIALRASARTIIDEHRTTILALVHTTTEDAEENARRLERNLTDGSLDGTPWSERFESWTITTDGRLTLALINEGNHPPAGRAELDRLWPSEPA